MKNSTKAFIGATLLIGCMVAYTFIEPITNANTIRMSSDSATTDHTLNVGTIGNDVDYIQFCSDTMVNTMRQSKIKMVCDNNSANDQYQLIGNMSHGPHDVILMDIGSYVKYGSQYNYPGSVVAALETSKISILSTKYTSASELRNADKLVFGIPSTNKSLEYVVWYTRHIMGLTSPNIDVVELGDHESMVTSLQQGAIDVAVSTEPFAAQAVQSGANVIQEYTSPISPKVVIVDRRYMLDNPNVINALLSNYFDTVSFFHNNPSLFEDDVLLGVPELATATAVKDALVDYIPYTLRTNCDVWFHCSQSTYTVSGVEKSLTTSRKVLNGVGEMVGNPFPNGDPTNLFNSSFLKTLYNKSLDKDKTPTNSVNGSLDRQFEPLTDDQWSKLNTIQSPSFVVMFKPNSSTPISKANFDGVVKLLEQYPNNRIRITGHTGVYGNPVVNTKLSNDRAVYVKQALLMQYNMIDGDRIETVAVGGNVPTTPINGENVHTRSYSIKQSRVEIHLLENNF